MSHIYECSHCRESFVVTDNEEYDDNPATRCCKICNASGGILYHGRDTKAFFYAISDYIAAPGKGIMAPHDGKVYDSKSAYYKSLKQSGHMVVEPGMTKEKREQRGDFNVTKELKEAAQKHGLIG